MKYPIWLYSILICAIPTLTCAQTSVNFDEITVGANGFNHSTTNPRIIGNWSLGILDNSGAYTDPNLNFLDGTNVRLNNGGTNMANGANDKALNVYGDYHVAKTFVMKSSSTTPQAFSLSSFSIDAGTTTWLAEGFLNGARVVTQAFTTKNLTPMKVNLIDSKWQNIDEFRIEQQNGEADIYFFLDDIAVATPTALPVTFPMFKAEVLPQGVQLKWELGINDGVQSFTVQRSLDRKIFKDIGSVLIATSQDKINYTFLDHSAQSGVIYYRLKVERSINNSDVYSQLIQVNNSNSATTWRIYPNPIQNQLNISAPKTVQNQVILDIITSSGQMLKSIVLPGQTQKWQLNVSFLARGVYFLRLQENGQVIIKLKMVKL